jgi:hypothetical protein
VLSDLLGVGSLEARNLLAEFVVIQTLSLGCIVFGIVAALVSCYKLSLLLLLLVPLVVMCNKLSFAAGTSNLP